MARKTVNRKELREQAEAAEAMEEAEGTKAKKKKKKATKRKTRTKKEAAEVRQKVFWGVFNHAMKRVALYDFNQRKAAEKRAKELSAEGKPPHFVQKVKEVIEE